MEIKYRDIILRDMVESDISDDIRWYTVETAWALWDGPWEMEEQLRNFELDKFRQEEYERLNEPLEEPRWRFELDTVDGVHIGAVNSYLVDENWNWISLNDTVTGKLYHRAIGIDISESGFWGNGFGKQALAAFIRYFMENGITSLCLQTWSGNTRMIHVAESLGFEECCRKIGIRFVRGCVYDGLTFRLDLDRFNEYLALHS